MWPEEWGNLDDLKVYVAGEDGESMEVCSEVRELSPVDMGEDTPPLWFDAQPISGSFTVRLPWRRRIRLKWKRLKTRIWFKWYIWITICDGNRAKAIRKMAANDIIRVFRHITRRWR